MIKFNYIKLEQPYATLFLGKMKVAQIDQISFSNHRTPYNSNGIQRKLDNNRIKSIREYAKQPDAIFPTAIVLSTASKMVKFNEGGELELDDEDPFLCSIIDGQHRIKGIMQANMGEKFEVPVVMVFDSTLEIDAEIFSTINGNQQPVSKSLVYDLYGLSNKRTVQKVAHEIIKILNTDPSSQLSGKVKMLGIKDENSKYGEVSQAAMVDSLMTLMTNDSNTDNKRLSNNDELEKLDKKRFVFREWFINQKDHLILKVLLNYFNAWLTVRKEFDQSSKYFPRTIGYIAAFQLLRVLFSQGDNAKDFSTDFFMDKLQKILLEHQEKHDSNNRKYSSSQSGARDLFKDLLLAGIQLEIINEEELLPHEIKMIK